jgi:ribosomal protein L15
MPLQRRLPKRGFKSHQLKYNGEVTWPTCSAWAPTKSTC